MDGHGGVAVDLVLESSRVRCAGVAQLHGASVSEVTKVQYDLERAG